MDAPTPSRLHFLLPNRRATDSPAAGASEPLIRFRRIVFWLAAAVVASFLVFDAFQPRFLEVAIVRALWIGVFVVAGQLQRPGNALRATRAAQLASVFMSAAAVAIIALNGGTASIYQGMLLATPFLMLVGVVERPSLAILNGAICGLGGAAIRMGEGQAWAQIASWLYLSVVMTGAATWATVATRHVWQLEIAAERGRLEAQAQLADSERQRAESERLADVGRLAARVAHEVNNPLAVVKSNVQWLGATGLTAPDAERAEVVADTLASVERITDAVDSVRRQAGERPLRGERDGRS